MLWGLLGFAIGALLGSLVKTLSDRSLNNQSFWGRSICPKCQQKLAWFDLFPLISYFLLKGRCRYCHQAIGPEYWLVEVMVGALVGVLFWQSLASVPDLISKTFFITILAVVFLTDYQKMFIPDRVILPSIIIGLILSRQFLVSLLTGLLIGGFFFSLLLVTRGKGMGGGDVKLGSFIGIMLGFPQAVLAIILSFFSGAIFSLILIFFGKKHFGQTLPFGPFLVLGSLITLFWGGEILNWYLKLGT